MSQPSRPLRQGLWQPRFSIRHDAVITVAELNSLRQRLQSIDKLLNNVADTLQKVRLRPSLEHTHRAGDATRFGTIAEKLQAARGQLAARLQLFSTNHALNLHAEILSEVMRLVKDVDTVLAGCCSALTKN